MQQFKREKKFQDSYSSIMEGKDLAARIKKQQDLEDQAERNKKVTALDKGSTLSAAVFSRPFSPRALRFGGEQKSQFQEWNLEVYGKIQGRVAEQLEATTSAAITKKRNAEFQKFLDLTNSKGAIFRDIIIESEYDPLEPNRSSIKVRGDAAFHCHAGAPPPSSSPLTSSPSSPRRVGTALASPGEELGPGGPHVSSAGQGHGREAHARLGLRPRAGQEVPHARGPRGHRLGHGAHRGHAARLLREDDGQEGQPGAADGGNEVPTSLVTSSCCVACVATWRVVVADNCPPAGERHVEVRDSHGPLQRSQGAGRRGRGDAPGQACNPHHLLAHALRQAPSCSVGEKGGPKGQAGGRWHLWLVQLGSVLL